MKTTDPRIRVENHGRENWRTVARDDSGEWAITGPPYPTATEAMAHVAEVAVYYFGNASEVDAHRRQRDGAADAGPGAVCWEHQAGELPVRLSFSIKVF